jgi:hypothetical protein
VSDAPPLTSHSNSRCERDKTNDIENVITCMAAKIENMHENHETWVNAISDERQFNEEAEPARARSRTPDADEPRAGVSRSRTPDGMTTRCSYTHCVKLLKEFILDADTGFLFPRQFQLGQKLDRQTAQLTLAKVIDYYAEKLYDLCKTEQWMNTKGRELFTVIKYDPERSCRDLRSPSTSTASYSHCYSHTQSRGVSTYVESAE